MRQPHDEATAIDSRRVSSSGTIPLDSTQLTMAIEEIERAAAALTQLSQLGEKSE